jgi:hypothetical protein
MFILQNDHNLVIFSSFLAGVDSALLLLLLAGRVFYFAKCWCPAGAWAWLAIRLAQHLVKG